MFFRKKAKIAEAAAENVAEFAQIIEVTQRKVAKIKKIPDIGKRYLALLDMERTILELQAEGRRKTNEQIADLLERPRRNMADITDLGGVGGGAMLAMAGLFTLASGGAALPVIFLAGAVASAVAGETAAAAMKKRVHSSKNAISDSRDSFCNAMRALWEDVSGQKEALFHNNLSDLLSSGQIERLCDKVPAIKDAFVKAAIRDGVFSPPVKLDKSSPPKPKK